MTDKSFTLNFNGGTREVLMSYGLLTELTRLVSNITDLGMALLDPDVRDKMLVALLSERTPTGKVTKQVGVTDLEVDIDQVGDVLDWALEHIIDFFVKRTEAVQKISEKTQGN